MASLRQKRFNYDYDCSTEDEESDFNSSDQSSNNHIVMKGKRPYSTALFEKCDSKKAKLCFSSFQKEINDTSRKPKSYNRNALMARENRIKKKLYVENLEQTVEKIRDENKKLSSILDNQSTVISDLRKELKYLKNVLANSSDIGRLLKCINQNTGMPVTSSVNNNIKFEATRREHPWSEDAKSQLEELNNLTVDEFNGEFSSCSISPRLETDLNNWNDLFSDLQSPILCPEDSSLKLWEDVTPAPLADHNNEHNYTNNSLSKADNVGVCLHIARHKVSLEFCSSCSENANLAWDED